MKSSLAIKVSAAIGAAVLGLTSMLVAQPAASPLDIQGLDRSVIVGVRARAMGGSVIANANDASALFSNPAALGQLTTLEIRAGGSLGALVNKQEQQWVPMREVPGMSLLFEGLTGTVKTPDSAGVPGHPLSAWQTVQRQYDNILPNWKRNKSRTLPMSLAAVMPLTVGTTKFVAGIGVAQAIDLNHYYQNNNAMSPYLGQLRPDQQIITIRNDTTQTRWYQYTRTREGSVYGVTPGVSVGVLPGLTIGGSATIMTGSSDDNEYRQDRGLINMSIVNGVPTNFMVDTVRYYQTTTGTSTYSGNRFTFGAHFTQDRFTIGVTITPSMTLTRAWSRDVAIVDTTQNPALRADLTRTYHESGKDKLTFPFTYAFGVTLKPTDKWTVAFDYEMRNLADAEFVPAGSGIAPAAGQTAGSASHPWVNTRAALRFGAEYRMNELVALRGGYHQDFQAFAPDGAAIIGEPASGDVYSLGAGIDLGSIRIDLAYEYSLLKYPDIYQSNVNYNSSEQNTVLMELAYRF